MFNEILFSALRQAGALLLKNFHRPRQISYKGNRINLVTEVDRAADRLIRRLIHQRFPSHNLLTEESEALRQGSAYTWIIDPLDGTTNYAHHFPQCCVSIALEHRALTPTLSHLRWARVKKRDFSPRPRHAGEGQGEGTVVLGGVYDPFRDELFWAEQGKGAWLIHAGRRQRLQVSATPRLAQALLLTGFPYDRREHVDLYLSYVRAFLQKIQGIRRAGAAALDLCWVAAGRVDGYWEWRLKPWDSAAGGLIVAEAGGRLSDFSGRAFSIYGSQTLATNGCLHAQMLAVMRSLRR